MQRRKVVFKHKTGFVVLKEGKPQVVKAMHWKSEPHLADGHEVGNNAVPERFP
jgi:hypothetical protein